MKNKLKIILVLCLTLALTLGFVGCGKKKPPVIPDSKVTPVSVTIAPEATFIIGKGKAKLPVSVKYSNDTIGYDVNWSSDKTNIVTAGSDGSITPVAVGSAIISASATSGDITLAGTCTVHVVADATSLIGGNENGMIFTLVGEDSNATIGYSVKAETKVVADSPISINGMPITETRDITEAIIPASFKGVQVSEIAENGFRQCTKLTKFSMGTSVTKINKNAFMFETESQKDSGNLTECKTIISSKLRVNLLLNPNTILAPRALADSFFKIVTIPEGATEITENAFEGSTITEVIAPTTLTSIKGYAFAGCQSLKTIDLSKTNLTIIGEAPKNDRFAVGHAFLQCGVLKTVGKLPQTLKTIEYGSFATCSNLTDIALNDGLVKIGNDAFMQSAKIPSLSIPSSVTTVGQNAFGNWGAEQTITVAWKQAEKPAGYNKAWTGENCNAKIVYKT